MTVKFKNRKIKSIARVLLIFFIFKTTVFAQADLIVVNADVRTLEKTKPRAEAVAVTGNRISAIGANREIRQMAGANTKIIDAGGKLLLPGFNDAHVHFAAMGNQFFYLDLREAKTPAEVSEKIKFNARFLPEGAWLVGGGWNHANWTPNALPTKDLLDAAAPAHPVFLYQRDAKSALASSFALKLARIDDRTRIAGGEIMRDGAGEANGILTGAAMDYVRRFAPAGVTPDKLAALETASRYAAAYGVTSVQDMSADDNTEIYRELARRGKLKTRVYDCAALSDWQRLVKTDLKKASGDALVRRGCLKGLAEGDDEASAARLFEEISAADRAGLQVMVHAVGSLSNAQTLSVFERVRRANGVKDRRFRIEHAHGFRPQDIRRFAASGIIASVQPALFSDGAGKSFDPLRALLMNKTALAFGSDSSMIPVDPLAGIAAAVETSDPKQKLSVEEAVRFYTSGAAYAEFQENEKGTIAVGKLADLVILSNDIFTINPAEIRTTRVLTTVFNGRVVFEAQ